MGATSKHALLDLLATAALAAVPELCAEPNTILTWEGLPAPDCCVQSIPEPGPVRMMFDAGWGSRYMGEGIDLWDSPLYYVTPRAFCGDFALSSWYGVATDNSKGELKFRLDYGKEFGKLTVGPWYEQSFVFPGNRGIPRPGLKLTWNFSKRLFAGTDFYWQHNDGIFRGYYAVFAGYRHSFGEDWEFEAMTRYGYNGGYVRAADRGSNAQDFNTRLRYHVSRHVSVEVFANYALALSSLRRAHLGDDFYYGASIRFEF